MVGYFTSGVLSELAATISCYLRCNANVMRFIISPQLSQNDLLAIQRALEDDEDYFEILFPGLVYEESSLRNYTLAALSSLVSQGRIELRLALKESGIFHAKAWFFTTPYGGVVIHGSSNATHGGLGENFEQLVLSRSWLSDESEEIYEQLKGKFNCLWRSELAGVKTIPVNKSTMETLEKLARDYKSPIEDFQNLYHQHVAPQCPEKYNVMSLKIPDYLVYREGPFKHQGEAVDCWLKNAGQGIVSIATGGGKTISALIAAANLLDRENHLMIVVAVPTKALMHQWEKDIKEFGVEPVNTAGKSRQYISASIKQGYRALRLGVAKVQVVIVTYNALFSGYFEIDGSVRRGVSSLLIADEVHNVGSEKSKVNFPVIFNFKLGLSATHERQYDEEGTVFIKREFGDVVYEYGLGDAIGNCLVPYKYKVYFTYLTAEEEDEFQELTEKIKRLSFAANLDGDSSAKERWEQLCIKRRALIESAQSKINKLFEVLPHDVDAITKTLIFCTDKKPEQLEVVNCRLNKLGIRFHQVTADETSSTNLLKGIVDSFSKDELQVLTSKRVLDEGFNVPQIEKAYLLASNTVRRQWIQRLGRVLRLSPATGKTFAEIFDFVILPQVSGKVDEDLKSLLEGEYNRVEFFSRNSKNYMEANGGYWATEKIMDLLRESS